MSYTMCSRITFPASDTRKELKLYFVTSVSIQSSWKMLTDTAEIILPRKLKLFWGENLNQYIKPGDPVKIELGYNRVLLNEFEGYVTRIERGVPVAMYCEDEMYKLKRKKASYSKRSVKLGELLKDLCGEYEIVTSFGDTELGAVRYAEMLVSQILEDVKKKTGLYSYFIGKTLYCGNVYTDKVQLPETKIHLERNAVSQDLQQTEGDYEVTALAILKGGKKLEAKAGTKGAETVNLTYNDKDKTVTVEVLKEFAERYYEGLKKQKYKGGIELFGIPAVTFGQVIDLKSDITPEMDGKYYIEKVTKEFSDNATYRQKVELGGRAE
jgi:hypothetical protein